MLIVTRAGVFRGLTMRSIDDLDSYYIPIKNRVWSKNGFRKRNMRRLVPLVAPTADTPENTYLKIDLDYFEKVAPFQRSYQVTLRPWTE